MFRQGAGGWKRVLLLAAGLWLSSSMVHGHGSRGGGHFGIGLGLGYGLYGGYGLNGYGYGYGGNGYGPYYFRNYGAYGYGLPYGYGLYGYGPYGYGSSYRYRYSYYPASSYALHITRAELEELFADKLKRDAEESPLRDDVVRIRLVVPEDAQVWFNGVKTHKTGRLRDFESPVLTTGKTYLYDVKAQWREDGKRVERAQTVRVRPGSLKVIDLTQPE